MKKIIVVLFVMLSALALQGCSADSSTQGNSIPDTSQEESVNTPVKEAESVPSSDDLVNDPNHQGELEQNLDEMGDTLREQNDTGDYNNNDEAIWQYCNDRWDYYDDLEGGYSGDKYTNQVFQDAAERFGISADDAYLTWQRVDQEKLGI